MRKCPACEDCYVPDKSKLGLCPRCERVGRVVVALFNLGVIKFTPRRSQGNQLILPSGVGIRRAINAQTRKT